MKTVAAFVLLAGTQLLGGCASLVAHKNKPAPPNTPPPVALNFTVTQAPVELLVQTVIVFQGPGSWAREAHWDEYVVVLTNRSKKGMTIAGAWLTGMATTGVAAGTEPWALERASFRVKTVDQPLRDEWEIAVRGLAQRVTDILAQPPS